MKINKLLQLLVMCCFVFACTKDTFEDKTADDTSPRIAADQFDNSYLGVYKGMFTTLDGETRGSVVVTLSPNEGIAQITLSSGEMIELKSSRVKLSLDNTVSNLRFSSAGLSNIDATLDFSVEGDGLNPAITNVTFDSKESDIFIAKNLSRAPLTPITGTYVRTSGTGGFPSSGRTWNVMSVGAGDGQSFSTQIAYGGRTYNTGPVSVQSGCGTSAGYTTCTIAGSTSILGNAVSWTGTHRYNAGNAANETQCAQVSGTWSAPSFGNSSGTFVSDTSCTGPAVANDLCAGAIAVGAGTYTGSTANASNTDTPNTCNSNLFGGAANSSGPGVWYSYTASNNLTVVVDTEGSTGLTDTQLRVFSGACGALVCVANDDDSGTGLLSRISFIATAGITYRFFLGGYDNSVGTYTLNVAEITPPANDLCANATPIACGGTASGSTVAATTTGAPATCTTALNTASGVWYSFSTPTAKQVSVNTVGSDFDTKLGVFSGTCAGLVCVIGNDNGGFFVTPQSELSFNATAGTNYYIYVTGAGTTTGNYVLNVTCVDPPTVPANDLCANATTIACGGTASGNTTLATTTGAPGTCTTALNTAPGVWYNFSTPTAKIVTVNTTGGNYDTKLGVFTGACGALVCVGGNDDGGPEAGTGKSQVVFTATAGTLYKIYVTGFSAEVGTFNLNVTCVDPPITPCNSTFVDHAGTAANYAINRNDTYYFDAGAGNKVSIPLTVFNLENGWDFMRIYNSVDGFTPGTEITNINGRVIANISATRIGFTGTGAGANSLQGQTIVSAGRYLVINFKSDGSTNAAGWQGTVGCIPARMADDSHIRTSATFMPAASPSIPKVMSAEDRMIQDYDTKKLQQYNQMLQKSQGREIKAIHSEAYKRKYNL